MFQSQHKNSEFSLSPAALENLIRHAAPGKERLVVALLALTGMRRAELQSLRVGDIDLACRRIYIRAGKGARFRFAFISPRLDRMLRPIVDDADPMSPVLAGRGGSPLSLRTINNLVAAAGRRSGIANPNPRYRNVNPHLLRHSFARNWKRAQGSLESLQKLLGHASFQTTMDLYGTESLTETEENYHRTSRLLVTASRRNQ